MNFVETERTELKQRFTDAIPKEIVAFLNTDGGAVYIGVNDDGSVCGVENLDDSLKKIADIIENQILPDPRSFIELGTKFIEQKHIIEIKIQKGEGLYYIKKYGELFASNYDTAQNGGAGWVIDERQSENEYDRFEPLIEQMAERGIACNVHYKPLPMMTAYEALGFDINNFPPVKFISKDFNFTFELNAIELFIKDEDNMFDGDVWLGSDFNEGLNGFEKLIKERDLWQGSFYFT